MKGKKTGNMAAAARILTKVFIGAVAVLFVASLANTAVAKEKMHSATGVIQSVDLSAKTLTLKEKKGELTIVADENTKVKMGKEQKAFEDLKTGEKISVRYRMEDGKYIADSIAIKHHGKTYEKMHEGETRG